MMTDDPLTRPRGSVVSNEMDAAAATTGKYRLTFEGNKESQKRIRDE
jgi:hypothetical protein